MSLYKGAEFFRAVDFYINDLGSLRATGGRGRRIPSQIPAKFFHYLASPVGEECPILAIWQLPRVIRKGIPLFRRRSDVELLAAPDAKLGIELAQAHRPDLILMDINLPGMDGTTAMKYLQNKPETQDIPVVAISANAMPRDVKQGLAAGFCDYLTKPLDVTEFHRVVVEILQGERAQ